MKKHLIYAIAGWASLALGYNLHAQSITTTNNVNISLTITVQGAANDDGTTTTYARPTVTRLSTRSLLQQLAVDENIEGRYGSSTFPSGAKLVSINNDLQVLDRNNNLLVDVSDLLAFSQGDITVTSGKTTDATGAGSTTTLFIGTITFNDSGVSGGGGIDISASGLATERQSVSNPDRNNNQTESDSASIGDLAGDGTVNGANAVVTGSASESGRGSD